MALGIDDALNAAAAGISLTDTVVKTVNAYRKKGSQLDIERLIDEVRITALQRLDEADQSLAQLERTLKEKGVDLGKTLQEVIESTPFWHPFEEHKLKRIRRSFNALADATYSASDDIAALVRCKDKTKDMGVAIVESARSKHQLFEDLLNAKSVKSAIDLLRAELVRHKAALNV
jgi:hypothetical protein